MTTSGTGTVVNDGIIDSVTGKARVGAGAREVEDRTGGAVLDDVKVDGGAVEVGVARTTLQPESKIVSDNQIVTGYSGLIMIGFPSIVIGNIESAYQIMAKEKTESATRQRRKGGE